MTNVAELLPNHGQIILGNPFQREFVGTFEHSGVVFFLEESQGADPHGKTCFWNLAPNLVLRLFPNRYHYSLNRQIERSFADRVIANGQADFYINILSPVKAGESRQRVSDPSLSDNL